MRLFKVKIQKHTENTNTNAVVGKLTIAFLIFSVSIVLFAWLAHVVRGGAVHEYESQLLLWVNAKGSPLLDTLFLSVTTLGGKVAVGGATLILAIYLLFFSKKTRAMIVIAGVGGAGLLNLILKLIYERPRPDLWTQLVVESSYSFPSGHAMASAALAGVVVAILWPTKWRSLALVIGSIYVILIGFSRIYLGVHYLSDVLAGWVVSLAWVVLTVVLVYGLSWRLKTDSKT